MSNGHSPAYRAIEASERKAISFGKGNKKICALTKRISLEHETPSVESSAFRDRSLCGHLLCQEKKVENTNQYL